MDNSTKKNLLLLDELPGIRKCNTKSTEKKYAEHWFIYCVLLIECKSDIESFLVGRKLNGPFARNCIDF